MGSEEKLGAGFNAREATDHCSVLLLFHSCTVDEGLSDML